MDTKNKNLYELLCEQKDPRRQQGTRHPLPFILIIVIMATMSGALSMVAMADFARRHKAALLQLFNLKGKKRRIPSRLTIARLLSAMNFEQFSLLFYKWAKQYVQLEKGEWVSLDGKAIRGTVTNPNNQFQNFTSLVSVFAQKRGQVLALGSFQNNKGSEISLVKKLIKGLNLEGVVFSLDALHCQKGTVQAIVESGNDYVIGVKENQKTLYNQLKKKLNAISL
jgi:DDE_Tnp_1-associated/Transposase DDE domain